MRKLFNRGYAIENADTSGLLESESDSDQMPVGGCNFTNIASTGLTRYEPSYFTFTSITFSCIRFNILAHRHASGASLLRRGMGESIVWDDVLRLSKSYWSVSTLNVKGAGYGDRSKNM